MNSDLDDSVTLITSEISDIPDFGSGFVIHQDEGATFLLTCAHVVKDVGGTTKVKVGAALAEVFKLGSENGCDLAILKVDKLLGRPPLKLSNSAAKGKRIVIAGYYQNETKVKTLRKISGVIGERTIFELDGDRTVAWDIEIDESSRYFLQPGYSGSPVVDEQTGATVGVISQRVGTGRQGLAISIEAVKKIWRDIPSSLLQNEPSCLRDEIAIEKKRIEQLGENREQLGDNIEQIEFSLRSRSNQQFDESLSWLSHRSALAERVGREALKYFSSVAEHLEKEEYTDWFYLEIELYLELIYYSLVTQRYSLLDEPCVSQCQPNSAIYVIALQLVKRRVPIYIVESQRKELEARIEYLTSRILN